MALVDQRMGRIGEEPFQVNQQDSTFPPIAPKMPRKLFFQSPEMPMQPFSPLTGPVVIDHTGAIQGNQGFIT